MKRSISLLISAGIIAVVAGQDRSIDVTNQETDSINFENDASLTKSESAQENNLRSKEVTKDKDVKVASNFDHEKDFKKSAKEYRQFDAKRGKAYNKGEAKEKSGLNKFKAGEGEYEQAVKSGHNSEHKRGNFQQENFEENIQISSENGKRCGGERVKANRWIKKAHRRRGFNENCGNKRNENLMRGKDQHIRKNASKKFEEDCKQEGRSGEEGSVVKVHRRASEVDEEVKGNKKREVDYETKHKDTVAAAKAENETDKYSIEKAAGLKKTVTNEHEVEVDRENN